MTTPFEQQERLRELEMLPEAAQDVLLDAYEVALVATPAERSVAAETLASIRIAAALIDGGAVAGRLAQALMDVLAIAPQDINYPHAQDDRARLARERNA